MIVCSILLWFVFLLHSYLLLPALLLANFEPVSSAWSEMMEVEWTFGPGNQE